MRRHSSSNLGLFTDDHTLKDARVLKAEGLPYGGVCGGEGSGAKLRRESVEGVADLIDGTRCGLGELGCGGIEGVWVEDGG